MPESNDEKLIVALVVCSRCGNPFMIKKGQKKTGTLICDNCIKLEQSKIISKRYRKLNKSL